jgi:hypothetical protein
MEVKKYGESEIRSLLSKTRQYNQSIGEYKLYAPFELFDYAVKLSNGRIILKVEDLQDDERGTLSGERIKSIANSFVPDLSATESTPNYSTKNSNTINSIKNESPTKKKSKAGLWIFILFLIVLLGCVGLMLVNNPNAIPGVKLEINTPKPIVVTKRADNSNSGLFNEKVTIYATIQNQGGDGNVLVTFSAKQNGKEYKRTEQIYIRANETQDLQVTIEEVKLLGDIVYDVNAIAQ